jgi:hypothetical protein
MIPALRRALGLVLLLVPVVALAGPDRTLDLDDVLRLHYAGVSEDIILSEIIVTDSVFHLSVDDILRLKEAGVSERLIQFLVDTGRDDASEADVPLYADDAAAGESTGDEEWVNEIEELEPTTTYQVSLSYSYPAWWYDCYWYDYWYWDFHYYPYSCSWVFHLGAWYPGWYGYRTCWAPAYWGYRSWWYDRWDYPWWAGSRYCSPYDPYYSSYPDARGYGTRRHELSRTKTKSGSGSTGLPLYADAGLKLPDGRLKIRDARSPVDLRDKTRGGRPIAADRPERPDGKTPVRAGQDPERLADGAGGRKPVVPDRGALGAPEPVRTPTPVRDVRSPASGGRPVRVRTLSDPSGEVAEPPSREDKPTRPPVRSTPSPESAEPPSRGDSPEAPARPSTPSVKPAPEPAPKTPSVAPSPPPRSVKPAPAPAPKSSAPPRSSPPPSSRSKGTPSTPKGRR